MTDPWYCTREQVAVAADVATTARQTAQVDRAASSAARLVDDVCDRRFFPLTATRYFDWPDVDRGASGWRLELDDHEVISVSALTVAGTAIDAADFFLEPANDGPPYDRIEIDQASSAAFESASGTWQRSIAVTGVFGYSDDEAPAGTLAEALDASETGVDIGASEVVGVGSLLRVGTERMVVTDRAMLDTTVNTGGALTASKADQAVAVADGTAFAVGEVILVDSERMLVVDVAGNTLIVRRGWDGSTLAAHSSGADIYAARRLTVERGAVGTTAASHLISADVVVWTPPPLVAQTAIAEALNTLAQEESGYARTVGAGEGEIEVGGRAIRQLRKDLRAAHGRLSYFAV